MRLTSEFIHKVVKNLIREKEYTPMIVKRIPELKAIWSSFDDRSLGKIECGRYNDNVSVSLLFDIADGLQIDITMLVTFSDMEKSMWWKPLSKD